MSNSPRRQRQAERPNAGVGVVVDERDEGGGTDDELCICCDPRNPLVMRPDFGALADGSAEYAICVLHEPQPVVYRNRGDGLYQPVEGYSLSPAGEIIDAQGNIVARVTGDSYQRLSTVDDDDDGPNPGGSAGSGGFGPQISPSGSTRPSPHHVDLSQDDFYAA